MLVQRKRKMVGMKERKKRDGGETVNHYSFSFLFKGWGSFVIAVTAKHITNTSWGKNGKEKNGEESVTPRMV